MHPLKEAVEVKGSTEFTRSELVGILSFKLRRFSVGEAKERIKEWLEEGLLEEYNGVLVAKLDLLEEKERPENLLGEMVVYIARALGWTELEVMEGIKALRERYGDLDERVLAYLFGLEKGIDMSRFKDRLEV
ncbi:DUF2240 family protein [Thermococcus sp.]|uniref:DUF2240 family protein n=1 Tax=Thermococcus sp. TaxID=35749 RepID=UPI0025F6ACF8|nr:DUF2240 family protein [Thermococcus sp.]